MYTIQYKNFITRADVQNNKDKIFIFGDNDQRTGFGGQAKEMRGEQNTIGIRVKKSPSMNNYSFYTDAEYTNNVNKINEDLNKLSTIAYGKIIIFPSNGIGTGMAKLNITAPNTFNYLNNSLKQRFNINNGNIETYRSNDIIQIRKKSKKSSKPRVKSKSIKCHCKK